jgi:hypothetical protein
MADTKITALTAITTVDPAVDVLPIVDVSDTTMAASGTTKKITSNQILGAGGTATLASATITGDLTVDTSTLKVDSANNRVGIGTASPGYLLDAQAATAVAQILSTTGTNAAYLQISNTGGYFYLGRENSAGTTFAAPAYSAVLYAAGAYPLVTTVNGGERYRIASDGVATWSNVGGVAGTAMTLNSTGLGVGVVPAGTGGCLQLKSGITFPATQVASSDANTLDDYEEGTFTPNVGGTATYYEQTGRYTKIGNRVFITIRLNINTLGTGDNYRILGLPFTPSGVIGPISVGFFGNLAITANYISGYVTTASPEITMTATTAANATITNGAPVFQSGTDVAISASYYV